MDTDGKRPRPASVPTPGCTPELIDGIRAGLRAAADPVQAPRMQAYMKSEMPYLGVPMPAVRSVVAAQLRLQSDQSAAALAASAAVLWREARSVMPRRLSSGRSRPVSTSHYCRCTGR
jgi:hypothetical protein